MLYQTAKDCSMEKEKNNILQGIRILVAEDNKINQVVIRALLENHGLIPKIVSNGREAADAAEKAAFDLILMDVQMPEMDGYEAASAIREFEKQNRNAQISGVRHRTPIIAMTAHTFDDERQKCLEAGMDDYLSKPVDPDEMFAVLENHVRAENSNGDKGEIQRSPATASQKPESDLPVIDTAFGIRRVGGNADLYRKLLLAFSADYADAADYIRKHLEKGNTDLAWQMVHSIKGAAGNMGASELWKSAGELESCIRAHPGRTMGETDAYSRILQRIASALHEVGEAVECMRSLPADESSPANKKKECPQDDASELKHLLTELSQFLRDGDTEAAESLKKLKPMFSSSGMEALITRMEEQIFDFDFEKAHETLDVIVKRVSDWGN